MTLKCLTSSALVSLISAGFFALSTPATAQSDSSKEATETFEKLKVFADAFSIIRENYVEPIDDAVLMENAINGALEALDPHSVYVPMEEFDDNQKSAHKEYGGLGIEVSKPERFVDINFVLPDGPAAKAGLVSGDKITAVEGESVVGKTLSEAVKGMRGLAGEEITVTVKSEGKVARDVKIIRAVVQGRVVNHRVQDGLGIIRIESFNHPRLSKDVADALGYLKDELGGTIPGLIIDVRGNPGGLVDQTVEVAGHFLDGGEVFSARGKTVQNTQRYNAKAGELIPNVPIIVLINSRSASAAEILAGAVQDRGRGLVMGRRSFGKGSVQSIMPLSRDTGTLRLTTQRYFTPSGKSIQGRGIMPDILVAFRKDKGKLERDFREDSLRNSMSNADTSDYQEVYENIDFPPADWPDTKDYQLESAIKLLKSPNYKLRMASQEK